MLLTATTSNGARDSNGNLIWIFDPNEVDGEKAGLSWSARLSRVSDALRECHLLAEDEDPSGLAMPIGDAEGRMRDAMQEMDATDDHTVKITSALYRVIRFGMTQGATHFVVA